MPGERHDVLVTLKLDGGDRSYSISGLQGAGGYAPARILRLTPISQELSLVRDFGTATDPVAGWRK